MNANLTFNLGAQMMLMGQYEAGLKFLTRSQEIDPRRELTGGAIAHWKMIYGRLAEAVPLGQETVEKFPDYIAARVALIRSYIYLGMFNEASTLLDEVVEMAPSVFAIRDVATTLWIRKGDFEALHDFADSNFGELDQRIGDYLDIEGRMRARDYGQSLLYRGQDQLAADMLYWAAGGEEGIAATTYDDMFVLKLLGLAYMELDRFDEAQLLTSRCLELALAAHENGWATPNIFARIAEIYAIRGDVKNAVNYLERAAERGWRDIGSLEYGIFWRHLQDEPQLDRIKVLIHEHIEAQKQLLLKSSENTESI